MRQISLGSTQGRQGKSSTDQGRYILLQPCYHAKSAGLASGILNVAVSMPSDVPTYTMKDAANLQRVTLGKKNVAPGEHSGATFLHPVALGPPNISAGNSPRRTKSWRHRWICSVHLCRTNKMRYPPPDLSMPLTTSASHWIGPSCPR